MIPIYHHDSVLADVKETLLVNLPRFDNSIRESYLLSIRSEQADTIERRFSVREFGKVEFPYNAQHKQNTGQRCVNHYFIWPSPFFSPI